ncbi:MAG: hypothetical protein SWY16_24550 [Cyanobacteriota bacterium]|nr:hypothetical protein [Cyanobacteriota bacterium]
MRESKCNTRILLCPPVSIQHERIQLSAWEDNAISIGRTREFLLVQLGVGDTKILLNSSFPGSKQALWLTADS